MIDLGEDPSEARFPVMRADQEHTGFECQSMPIPEFDMHPPPVFRDPSSEPPEFFFQDLCPQVRSVKVGKTSAHQCAPGLLHEIAVRFIGVNEEAVLVDKPNGFP